MDETTERHTTTVRLPADLVEKIREYAADDDRSFNSAITVLLRKALTK